VARDVRRTPPTILRRYAAPPANTAYPLEYAYHLAGDVYGKEVLDLGCGTGQDASILAARGARVSALDISPELIDLAARRAELDGLASSISLRCGSAHEMPIESASVDVVFGIAILHHLDLAATAREVHRVLKPGGRAIFQEPIRDSRVLAFLRKLIPYRHPDISPFERPLRLSELETFASGFRTWRHREFELPWIAAARLMKLPTRLQARVRAADRSLLDRWPGLSRVATISVFEVTK
jgi:SAM-dependent methyltransferase